MKKILLFFITIIGYLSFCCYGCKSNEDYKLVKAIYFTTNGETRSASSKVYPDYENIGDATETEFYDYRANKPNYLFVSNTFYDGIPLINKTVNSYYTLTNEDIGATLICYTTQTVPGGTWYYPEKVKFKGWHYNYLYAKMIDTETLSYHFGNKNNTFNFKVTYYRIVEF